MPVSAVAQTQYLTIRLSRETIRKVKVLAAKQSTSISALVAGQIDKLVGEDEAYEQAMRRSLAIMQQGFHMGGNHHWDRDSLHDRAALRES